MKIVIVDDEKITLKWLKKSIEEIDPAYEVTKTFTNGQDAFEYCRKNHADVMFTDIRMPVMDGLELLKSLNSNEIELPYVIILSSYDDFSYARQAFKLGAKEFILKPEITKKTLSECLLLAKHKLNTQIIKYKTGKSDQLFLDIFSGNYKASDMELKTSLGDNNFITSGSNFSIFVMELANTDFITKAIELMQIFFEDVNKDYFIINQEMGTLIVILQAEGEHENHNTIKELYDTISLFTNKSLLVAVSGVHCLQGDLFKAYTEAVSTLSLNKFYSKSDVMFFSNTNDNIDISENVNLVRKFIAENNFHKSLDALEELFKLIKTNIVPIKLAKDVIAKILFDYFIKQREITDETSACQIEESELINIVHRDDFAKITNESRKVITTMIDALASASDSNKYSDSVRKIIKYVENNYKNQITLEIVADYVHLNRTYVSSLFKKETGENFFDYILNYRLNKARYLIKSSNFTIQDICIEVGISDSAYFSKLFKKTFNLTPMEYRNLT